MSAKEPTYHLVHFFKFNLLDLNGALNQSQRHVWKSLESLLPRLFFQFLLLRTFPLKISTKGGIISEGTGGFLLLQISKINIPKHYPKLLHPLHGNDKILIRFNI